MTVPKGKYLFKGFVENTTPLHIGSGNDDKSDMDILRNPDGIPFIPATSFTGVLKNLLDSSVPNEDRKQEAWKRFWGSAKKKDARDEKTRGTGYGSCFQCSDLNVIDNKAKNSELFQTAIRDGISIDNTRNIAKDKGKYDYEILEPGHCFNLKVELSYVDNDREFVEKIIRTIISCLTRGIYIGKMTNAGLGQVRLIQDSMALYQFDFRDKNDVLSWLYQDFSKKNITSVESLPFPYEIQSDIFRIKAKFQLKHSMIIRTYSSNPNDPDAVHLKSGNNHIIPGTSLKGAIRARAKRIAKTINPSKTTSLINELFGMVDPDQPKKKALKGMVKIRDIILPDYTSEKQIRIQVDRLTGGAIDGKLFETMPIFDNHEHHAFDMEITVTNSSSSKAVLGLLLLVLKDLWSGDLAIGGEKNVGRGVLKGVEATIDYEGKKLIIPEDISQIDKNHQTNLEKLVEEFNIWMEK